MRVISGRYRGRKLREPADNAIRPTTDKVKESIFNIIQFDIEGREALDLFAGTGQLGIEALSRGAKSVLFADSSPEHVRLVSENLERAGVETGAQVVRADAIELLKRGRRFDLVFLDPPYDSDLLDRALAAIFQFDILKDNGIIVCESQTDKLLPEPPAPYARYREYRYGRIKITLFVRNAV
ncbi:MAG: 16S rRNA (guanine(966)-N(2))-methyltransferase RsmD [Oscillospiraceae bacterium]|nr:16S rRNA (guanine(966)-N(2))-methyltransferase RsmD [Oscillospiraceae bacterium]